MNVSAYTEVGDCGCYCTKTQDNCQADHLIGGGDINPYIDATTSPLSACDCICTVDDATCQADYDNVLLESVNTGLGESECGCVCPLTNDGCKAANPNTINTDIPLTYVVAHATQPEYPLSECGCYCDATEADC